MAVGDLKGDVGKHEVIRVDAGGAVTKGDLVHIESDGYWDTVTDGDLGKFGVALDTATTEGDDIRVCIWGPVEVKASGAVKKGYACMAGNTGTVAQTDHANTGENCGTALEAAADAANFTLFVGMVD